MFELQKRGELPRFGGAVVLDGEFWSSVKAWWRQAMVVASWGVEAWWRGACMPVSGLKMEGKGAAIVSGLPAAEDRKKRREMKKKGEGRAVG